VSSAAFEPVADQAKALVKEIDHLYKLATRVHEADVAAGTKPTEGKKRLIKLDTARKSVTEHLKRARYFHTQAEWLQTRFPDADLCDVAGLVKLVSSNELEANDWSLTPGRYVGVATEEEDEDFDFEEALRDIHIEIDGLNSEAADLAKAISNNFKELTL
jgi:type I restriction enzyme M protein